MHHSGVPPSTSSIVGELEPREPRVGQVEGNRHPWDAIRAVPLVGEPEVGPEAEPEAAELVVELLDPVRAPLPGSLRSEIAEPEVEETLVGPARPLRLGRGAAVTRRSRTPPAGGLTERAAAGDAAAPPAAAGMAVRVSASGEAAEHRLGVADLELAGLLDVEGLHHAVVDQHRVALGAHAHAAGRQVHLETQRLGVSRALPSAIMRTLPPAFWSRPHAPITKASLTDTHQISSTPLAWRRSCCAM